MTAAELAAAFLEPRAAKLAALHPLVRAEVEAEVRWRAEISAANGDTAVKWKTDGPHADLQICIDRVLGRLRSAMHGRAVPSDHAIRRAQIASAAEAAGITLDGKPVGASDA